MERRAFWPQHWIWSGCFTVALMQSSAVTPRYESFWILNVDWDSIKDLSNQKQITWHQSNDKSDVILYFLCVFNNSHEDKNWRSCHYTSLWLPNLSVALITFIHSYWRQLINKKLNLFFWNDCIISQTAGHCSFLKNFTQTGDSAFVGGYFSRALNALNYSECILGNEGTCHLCNSSACCSVLIFVDGNGAVCHRGIRCIRTH